MAKLAGLALAAATTVSPDARSEQAQAAQGGRVPSNETDQSLLVYVGSRTSRERNARGDGINVYRMETKTGAWTHLQLVRDLVNPSFLAFDRDRRFLYVAHGDTSEVSSFSIDRTTGLLTFMNRESTSGKNPAHLAVDPSNRVLIVANHYSSTLAVFPIRDDGSIAPRSDLVMMQGTPGPHAKEQVFARPHQIVFDPTGQFAVVPDKGLDRIFVFRVDATAGKLIPSAMPSVAARETAGPRHVDFHPTLPYAYAVNELDSTVTAYRFDSKRGELKPIQILSALPGTYTGNSRAGEIAVAPSGRFVYASNRGHDSIAAFSIGEASGLLSSAGWFRAEGKTPRFFAIQPGGAAMYVANEDSDTVVRFEINQSTGALIPAGPVAQTGSPVCILFGPAREPT